MAEVDATVEPYAQAWDEHNAVAANASGPLLCVFGDSSSQGIGGSSWRSSWVLALNEQLTAATGDPWRAVNLSMSGGRFRDVIDKQIPAASDNLPTPDLTVSVAGANDVMWRRSADQIAADAAEYADALPAGSVVSLVGERGGRFAQTNAALRAGAERSGHSIFGIWRWTPGVRGVIAQDGFHPSDAGYEQMTALAVDAAFTHLGLPRPDQQAPSS